ncbi:MAG: 50S ribosomal protein L29 [archaeon]
MKSKEIAKLNKEELESKIKELRLEILKVKAKKSDSGAGGTKIREIKKTIARINTQLNINKK